MLVSSSPQRVLDVRDAAREALGKMQASATPAEAIQIGDSYLKAIGDGASEDEARVVAQTVAHVSSTLRPAAFLVDSARVVLETGLGALAAGTSGPIGKTLASVALATTTNIQETTFWGKSGDNAGQSNVAGWYLRAIEKESPDSGERLLATTVFAVMQGKARCFDSTAFEIRALELVRDGQVDTNHVSALLKDVDSQFRRWPGGGD